MDDWLVQFSANLAATLFGAMVSLVVVFLWRHVRALFAGVWRRVLASMEQRQERVVAIPTARQVETYARHSPVSATEFQDAIDFLKGNLPDLYSELRDLDFPDNWFGRHLTRDGKYLQYVLGGCAVAYLVSILAELRWLQILASALWLAVFVWVLLSLGLFALWFYFDVRKAIRHHKQLKAQIGQAMAAIAPSVSMTYSQIGQLTGTLAEHEIPIFQAEMAAIGLTYRLRDLELARYLANASAEDVERIGLDVAKKAGILEKIPMDKRSELANMLVNVLREKEVNPVTPIPPTAG